MKTKTVQKPHKIQNTYDNDQFFHLVVLELLLPSDNALYLQQFLLTKHKQKLK